MFRLYVFWPRVASVIPITILFSRVHYYDIRLSGEKVVKFQDCGFITVNIDHFSYIVMDYRKWGGRENTN